MFSRMVFREGFGKLRAVVFELQTTLLACRVRWPPKQLGCQFWTARCRARMPRRLLSERQAVHGFWAPTVLPTCTRDEKLEPMRSKG
jgi:hypothetical protein